MKGHDGFSLAAFAVTTFSCSRRLGRSSSCTGASDNRIGLQLRVLSVCDTDLRLRAIIIGEEALHYKEQQMNLTEKR